MTDADVLAERLAQRLAKARAYRPPETPVVARRPVDAATPLSAAQRRLWFLHQWAPLSCAYNIPVGWRLDGPLDLDRLRCALDRVVSRHEILRTRYDAVGGEPRAVVDPPGPMPYRLERCAPDRAGARAVELGRAPFALDRDWPVRACVLRGGPTEHVLLVTFHHIAADGWSVGLFAADLAAAYAGTARPEPVQYADLTHARRGHDHAEDLAYWRRRLTELPDPIELPADRPRPAVLSDAGELLDFELDRPTTAAVREFGRANRVTGYAVLLAGFAVLAGRYAEVDDLVLGAPVAGREGAADVLGCFVNTLALRVRLPSAGSRRELVRSVASGLVEDLEHGGLPYADLVEALPRQSGTGGLFNLQFVATDVPRTPLVLPGLTVTELPTDPGAAKLDLSLAVADLGGATIPATLTYSTDLFDRAGMERLAGHYRRAVAGLVTAPDRSVGELDFLDDRERAIVLARPARGRSPGTFLDRFDRSVRTSPDRLAVVAAGDRLSYRDLDRAATALAHRLRADGVGPETVVALDATRNTGYAVGLLGILKAGAAYLPLEPDQPVLRRTALCAAAGATRYVGSGAPPGLRTFDPPGPEDAESGVPAPPARRGTAAGEGLPAVRPADLAYVIFTSGSTGTPKGVAVEHGALLCYLDSAVELLSPADGATLAACSTLAADLAHTMVFTALATGCTLRLVDAAAAIDPELFADRLAEHPVDLLKLVPSHLIGLLDAADPARAAELLPRACLVLGGESLSWALVDRVRALRPELRIVNHYGPTEATVGAIAQVVPELPPGDRAATVPLGRPLPHLSARIVDRAGRPVPPGVPGELLLGGAGLARGYLARPPAADPARLPADPARPAEEEPARLPAEPARPAQEEPAGFGADPVDARSRCYRTGDRARWRADGSIEFLGRMDRQLKIRGYRVEPGEVEGLMRQYPGVRDAVVEARDGRLVGYLVGDPEGLLGWLAERLPGPLVPATVIGLDALPLTANGKVDRAALPRPGPAEPGVGRAPSTAGERAVADVFGEVLGCPPPSADDDFFALGGHSLLAAQVVSRLRQRGVGGPVTLPMLFAHPTVAGLAGQLGPADGSAGWEPIPAGPPGTPTAMSAAQRRLWFLDQAVPGLPAYNLPYALELTGGLDVAALRAALAGVVARHEALRTTFGTVDGAPVPVVSADAPIDLPLADLRGAGPDRVRAAIDAEFATGFDLATGPLLRARLLRTADDVHVLLVTFHHIVFDGWSLALFVAELAAGYAGEPVPAPRLRYADHARWQAEQDHTESLAYWRRELADAPAGLDLPTDRPRPPRPSYAGGAVPLSLPPRVVDRLAELARSEGGTVFTALLAAYQLLLARHAGVDDIVVGTPVAGRDHPDTERMIGFFVNMLAIRGRPRPELTFRAYLREVARTAVDAYAHADLPFERLVEHLVSRRDPSRQPVFGTMLSLRNTRPIGGLPGLTVRELDGPTGVAKYDLSLVFADDGPGRGLRGALEYSSDLFDRSTAERLAEAYGGLLDAVLADPDRTLAELPVMSDRERRRVVVEFNDTAVPGPVPWVADLVAEQGRLRPDAVAVRDDAEAITYGQLNSLANRTAHRLLAAGVGPGDLVAVCLPRSARTVAALLGVLRSGAAFLPLDPTYPAARLAYLVADAEAAALIADGEPPAGFAGAVLAADDPGAWPEADPAVPAPGAALAYVIYTSGSTGAPKGVRIGRDSLANFVAALRRAPGLGPEHVWLAVAPFAFDMSGLDLWLPLTTGAELVLVGRGTAMDGAALGRRLAEVGGTHLQATPTSWRLLLAAGWPGRPGLTPLCGGEALPPALARDLVDRVGTVWNLYGPTETTIYSSVARITGADVHCGRPIANTTMYVLDERMSPVPVGVTGELYIGGAGLAQGYHRRPELTAQRFVPDPIGAPGGRLYRTGDLARWRPDGTLEVAGRSDGQVKVRGYRIETGEIESVLTEHPGVAQAAVVVRPDRTGEPTLVGYVAGAAEPAALRAWLTERLPGYLVPGALIRLDRLPHTPNGKLDRAALPAPAAGAVSTPPARADWTAAQARVAGAFTAVLEHSDFGLDDDFFAVGGESMRAVRLVRQLDPRLSVLDLFTHPTVRALADRLSTGVDTGSRILHRLTPPRAGAAELSVVCVPFGGGGAIAYAEFAARAPADWDVYAVQPPGRDPARPDEPLQPLPEAADAAARAVLAEVPGPVVVYGHCIGAALAVALARRLEAAGRTVLGVGVGAAFPTTRLPGPLDLLSRLAPGRRQSDRTMADTLRLLGGLGEELPEAHRAQLARAIRHDARQGEIFYTDEYAGGGPRPLAAPICVVVGDEDRITEFYPERAHEWAAFGADVDLAVLPGAGHFFQRSTTAGDLVRVLRAQVSRWRAGGPPGNPPVVPPRARLGTFAVVTLGQLVSLIGAGLTTFALGVWTYRQTGAVTAFAAIAAFGILPALLAAPLAGTLADRLDRRLIMVWCDACGLLCSVGVALLLWSHLLALWHLYLMVTVTAAAATFRQPAYLAAVPQLTPKRYLGQANGVVGLGAATGVMLAQLLGGVLVLLVGLAGVLWLDAVSYGVALATLLLVRFPDLGFTRQEGPLLRQVADGWRFLVQRRGLLALCVFFAVANALAGVVVVLVTPLALASGSPAALGGVLAAQGLGLLVGSAVMAVWGGTRRRSAGMIGFVGLFAASAIITGLRPGLLFPAVGMFGMGLCGALINAHWLSLVQMKVGHDLLGRILATALMLARTLMPVGYLVAGPLVDRVVDPAVRAPGFWHDLADALGPGPAPGMALTIIAVGLIAAAWTLVGYRYRPLRELDTLLPDATFAALPSARVIEAAVDKDDHAHTPR
ncbi:amino acid adenylation domain-containing protein [Plantactinospora siamensis]|uniref:Amino acid adenylation domain-containing protein n=1 Tax=Plantactinospora siamensis TaxID=555372 RepID=A0ABV6NWT9_9ACTN